jgi:glycosyltransferase involved in cell wall biosynthesis
MNVSVRHIHDRLMVLGHRGAGSDAWYKGIWVARLLGGHDRGHLTLTLDGGAPVDLVFSQKAALPVLAALRTARDVVVHEVGRILIVQRAGFWGDPVLIALLRGIRAAGVVTWVEVDDNFIALDFADMIGVYGARYRREFLREQQARRTSDELAALEEAISFDHPRVRAVAEAKVAQNHAKVVAFQHAWHCVGQGVICSNEYLAASVRPDNPNVVIIPNAVDPSDLPPVARPNDGTIRIGYSGSWQHFADLPLVKDALYACARRPDVRVELHFWLVHPKLDESERPGTCRDGDVTYVLHGAQPDFPAFHREIGMLDIAVAPLRDTPFNHGRSPVKWLESSLHQTAMVVSDTPVFAAAEHGVTALKAKTAEEFGRQLRRLVDDAALRRQIGAAARAEVLARHTMEARRPLWERWLASAGPAPRERVVQARDYLEVGGHKIPSPWEQIAVGGFGPRRGEWW